MRLPGSDYDAASRPYTVPTGTARNHGARPPDNARMTWHVAFGFVLLVDRGRISGAWRYGLSGVVPVRVYVA